MSSSVSQALADISAGWHRRDGWLFQARKNIIIRYRGSFLGPFWIVLSTLIQISVLGVVYSRLFHMDTQTYVPWLLVSLICWQFLSTTIIEASNVFHEASSVYMNQKVPYTFFVMQHVTIGAYIFFHQLPLVLACFIIYSIKISLSGMALFVLGLFLNILFLAAITLIISLLCLRFRDFIQIIGNLMNIAFLVTPVIWMPHLVGNRFFLLFMNPFYHMMDVMRAPLLGMPFSLTSYLAAAGITMCLLGISFMAFCKVRCRIAFW